MDIKLQTRLGTVLGCEDEGVQIFKRIPYAAPPVSNRRFAAPQPAETWDGELDATDFGSLVDTIFPDSSRVISRPSGYFSVFISLLQQSCTCEKLRKIVIPHKVKLCCPPYIYIGGQVQLHNAT